MTAATARNRDVLTVPVRDDSAGYLDVLDPPRAAPSLSLRVMQNPLFAEVYERTWRPIFTRLFSFGGSSTIGHDRALTA